MNERNTELQAIPACGAPAERPSLKELARRLEWQIKPYTMCDPYEFARRDCHATLQTIGEMHQALCEISELVLSLERDAKENVRERLYHNCWQGEKHER